MVNQRGASNSRGLQAHAPNLDPSDSILGAKVTYNIYFEQAGTYFLWPRVYGNGVIDHSLYTSLNDEWEAPQSVNLKLHIYNLWIWMGDVAGRKISFEVEEPGAYSFGLWAKSHGL